MKTIVGTLTGIYPGTVIPNYPFKFGTDAKFYSVLSKAPEGREKVSYQGTLIGDYPYLREGMRVQVMFDEDSTVPIRPLTPGSGGLSLWVSIQSIVPYRAKRRVKKARSPSRRSPRERK